MSTMSVLLRIIAVLELLGSLVLSGLMMNATPDCSAFISSAPSYNACMARAPVGATAMTVLVLIASAAVAALVLFAIARVVDQTAENGQMLRNLMARQDGTAP